MLKELYIVRHGHPQMGTGLVYDRVPGPPLSDVGRAEAHITAEYLMGHGIECLYSSPLDRTLGTARIIAATLDIPLQVNPQLAEHRSDEKYDDVKARIRECLAGVDASRYSCAALVTHGSPIKAILQVLSHDMIDLTKHIYPNGNHVPTAGVWRASRDMFGAWSLNLVFKPVVETPTAHIPI
ncbi:MAG: phosphoglycerate mutase family protein [Chloroflexi bacterium]|nr:phosphoglycerate mutase family protein [Chloroflexota bacterium]MCL5274725.1 phosphoglycerate mutase family protein [Chloroflexota bacterium]